MKLSKRIQQVEESATLAATQKARDLKAQGHDVISLTVGESDFPTPDYISNAAIEAIKNHQVDQYTATSGIPELRQAIVDYHKRNDGADYTIDQVFVGAGAKNVLFDLFQVLVDEGDEVILPVPFWVSFSEHIKMADGIPVHVQGEAENLYRVTVEDLEAARTDKTIAVLINTPSNPTGAAYSKDEMIAIGNWAVEHNIIIIADEIYSRLVYNGKEPISFASLSEEIKNQTLVINGVSKSHAMTGWRIGYALGDKKVIGAMNKHASQSTGNPVGVSQYAAIAAYNEEGDEVEKMRKSFEERLNKAYELIQTVPGFKLPKKPEGAFYLFPDATEAAKMTGYESVEEFSYALIDEAHVVTVAGNSFGAPDCLRFSYAVSEETFAEGIRRVIEFIEKNKK